MEQTEKNKIKENKIKSTNHSSERIIEHYEYFCKIAEENKDPEAFEIAEEIRKSYEISQKIKALAKASRESIRGMAHRTKELLLGVTEKKVSCQSTQTE